MTKAELLREVDRLKAALHTQERLNIALCKTAKDGERALTSVIAKMSETDLHGSNFRLNELATMLRDAAMELPASQSTYAALLIAKAEETFCYLNIEKF